MNESYVFYQSFLEATRDLPAEQFKAIRLALDEYAIYGTVPEDLDPMLKGYFLLMKPQIDANNSRRENGRKGGSTPKQKEANESKSKQKQAKPSKPKANVNDNANVNANANANENVNENENANENVSVTGKRFTPPTIADVSEYCRERCNNVDPERFVDFYASKGWKVGNQSMKDWKACVRTWEKKEEHPPNNQGYTFMDLYNEEYR